MLTNLLPQTNTFTLLTGSNENLSSLQTAADSQTKKIVQMQQVHGAKVAVIPEAVVEKVPGVDGIVTTNPELMLVVRVADCLPILLYHETGVIAALHAGRKSTKAGLLTNTLQLLKQQFDITDNLNVWFGPHICEACYEVNQETHEHFSLYTHNVEQLENSGIDYQLTTLNTCTLHEQGFHSYRRSGMGVPMNYAAITQFQKSQ